LALAIKQIILGADNQTGLGSNSTSQTVTSADTGDTGSVFVYVMEILAVFLAIGTIVLIQRKKAAKYEAIFDT
jgi:hypothetical protein